MAKFDEGVIFWTLLLLGILLVWFFESQRDRRPCCTGLARLTDLGS